MKKLHDILLETFPKKIGISDFKKWKKEMRQHDITCDVVNLLDSIPQSTFYHPEFDALVHTFYVMLGVMITGKPELLEAAFLHDVGKAFRTNIGKNRIYHFGHPKKSGEFISAIQNRLKYPELTLRIVEGHMNDLSSKIAKEDTLLKKFIEVDKILSKDFYLDNVTKIALYLNRFKEKKVHLKQRFSKKDVIILVGISGSGKSRYTRKVDKKLIVCPDDIRRELTGDISDQTQNDEVWTITRVRMKETLYKYNKVILDATNVQKFLRVELMSEFNDCYKTAIVFHVDPKVAIQRIKRDIADGIDRSDVPEYAVERQYKALQKGYKSLFNEFNKVKEIK